MVDARNLTEELRFHGRYGSETQQECAERKNTERERAADRLETLERQIAELRAERDEAMEELGKVVMACPMSPETRTSPASVGVSKLRDNWEAAEADNARLRALPLKDEVERVLEDMLFLAEAEHVCLLSWNQSGSAANYDGITERARELLSRLRAGEQEGWRSMDSAPKNGTDILLMAVNQTYQGKPIPNRVTIGHWTSEEECRRQIGDCGGECRCPEYEYEDPSWLSWDGGFTTENPPNGWQPLPAAPSNQGGDHG